MAVSRQMTDDLLDGNETLGGTYLPLKLVTCKKSDCYRSVYAASYCKYHYDLERYKQETKLVHR